MSVAFFNYVHQFLNTLRVPKRKMTQTVMMWPAVKDSLHRDIDDPAFRPSLWVNSIQIMTFAWLEAWRRGVGACHERGKMAIQTLWRKRRRTAYKQQARINIWKTGNNDRHIETQVDGWRQRCKNICRNVDRKYTNTDWKIETKRRDIHT